MNKEAKNSSKDRRSEPRMDVERFHSVEINLGAPLPIYQFNLRDISENGVCILVKEDSPIIENIKVGQELDLIYYAMDVSRGNITKQLKTTIRHITKGKPGHYKGHYMVGVSFVE
jgi:hypothetical protein